MSNEEVNKVNEEELVKLDLLRITLEKAKSISTLEKYKEELARQIKEEYAEKMFYEFLKDIIRKLYNDDTKKISEISEILNKTPYNTTAKKYLDLLSRLSDAVSTDIFDNILTLHFYILFNDFPLHIAKVEINPNENPEIKVKLGYIFDEEKDINEISKQELMTYLMKFIVNLEEKMEEKAKEKCEDP
jgi:hypothetical protein